MHLDPIRRVNGVPYFARSLQTNFDAFVYDTIVVCLCITDVPWRTDRS